LEALSCFRYYYFFHTIQTKVAELRINILNILFVADVSISNVIGGAERVLYEQATKLVSRGHHVVILTRKMPNQDKDYEVIQGID